MASPHKKSKHTSSCAYGVGYHQEGTPPQYQNQQYAHFFTDSVPFYYNPSQHTYYQCQHPNEMKSCETLLSPNDLKKEVKSEPGLLNGADNYSVEDDTSILPPKWRTTTFPLESRLYEIDSIYEQFPLASQLLRIEAVLADQLMQLDYGAKVDHVYNPIDYAYKPHMEYYKKFCQPSAHVLLIGLNPGPNGMTQTGVPFGDVENVSQWMGICEPVESPSKMLAKKPIKGFDCTRKEVSGSRIWKFLRENFETPDRFFSKCFIYNYCPLSYATPTGKNITPAELPADVKRKLTILCDEALAQSVRLFHNCSSMVGIGRFAQKRIEETCKAHSLDLKSKYLLHPSPQNPHANKHWVRDARLCFEQLGLIEPAVEGSDGDGLENSQQSMTPILEDSQLIADQAGVEAARRNLFS